MTVKTSGHNPGAGFAIQGAWDVGRVGDEGFLATVLDEFDASFDFGFHASRGEVAFIDVLFGFCEGDLVQPDLIGFVEIQSEKKSL